MKDWEINKVNELYKTIDELQTQRDSLMQQLQQAQVVSNDYQATMLREINELKQMVEQLACAQKTSRRATTSTKTAKRKTTSRAKR
jgi:seryl-tRNA synthetase